VRETEIYTDDLRRSGADLARVAEDLGNRFQGLMNGVSGLGAAFGNDDIGMIISESYNAVQQIAQESFTSIMESLQDFGTGLHRLAEDFERTEQDNVAGFDAMGGQIGGSFNPR
jgi:hypothetical protein